MSTSASSQAQEEIGTMPNPILPCIGPTAVVILTPESDDPMFAEFWQENFDQLACKFELCGVRAIAVPWPTSPLPADSPQSFVYVANLAWGYHRVPDRWDAWLRAWPKQLTLINSPSLISWNTRKTYLQDLKNAGIAVIPTIYVEHIDEQTLTDAATHFGVSDLIVKPVVSACSFNIVRVLVGSSDFIAAPRSMSAADAVAELTRVGAAHSKMMIQPFMSTVVQEGEISVLVFDGTVSHAVRSNTQPDDYRVQFEHGGVTTAIRDVSSEMLELAQAAIAVCPETPVYARVDMIRNAAIGRLCVIELELIEPNLYLDFALDEGTAFVRAVVKAIEQNSS